MQALPVRLFHASLSGLCAGLILTLLFFHIQGRLVHESADDTIADIVSPPVPAPAPPLPAASDPPLAPGDRDGDGVPDDREIQTYHDPDNAADAAADFDHDGLTARQEYQLLSRSGGVSGNPLGKWTMEHIEMQDFPEGAWVWPVDINNRGEVLVSASVVENQVYRDTAFLIDAARVWHEIRPQGESSGGCLWGSDLNDHGQVVGSRYSADWSQYESFVWDKSAGYRPLMFNGLKAEAWKINNFGDWIGAVEDPDSQSMKPALVVDGINLHPSADWWPYLWFTDINDSGEAMGSFMHPQTGRYHTLLAHGGWSFDTGFLGGLPEFDENTHSWQWSAAMNAYGEFTGGAGGQRDNLWTYLGYHFDGEFNEIRFPGRELFYLSPESLNASNTITGYAHDSSRWGGFIFRDGVGLFLEELLPEAGPCYSSKINERNQILAFVANTSQVIVISPDQDQDGDGMPDDWEEFYGLDQTSALDAADDPDGDGTNNLGEFLLRSDPNASPVLDPDGDEIDIRPGVDTDGDGMPNVWEWENGLDYEDASDAPLDYDRDGYSNLQEFRLNTDPRGAPSYRMRVIGPFASASSASISSAVLGDGHVSGDAAAFLGANIMETAYFPARPVSTLDGGQRPALWSVLRGDAAGGFAFATSHGAATTYPVVQAPSGASLCHIYGSPSQLVFWSSPSAQPVTLSGAANQNDFTYLYNARISPSGTFVAGTRQLAGNTGIYQPVVWKMPASPAATLRPVPLVPPAGVTLASWTLLHVNDAGQVVANGQFSGQTRPILWQVSADGTSATASILPPLPGGSWAGATGISNQIPPLICGSSRTSSGQTSAVVWNAAGAITSLGTLPGGNTSSAALISRGGSIAGVSNVLSGNTLRQQPFLATFDAASASWKLQPQGEPLANTPSLTAINDSGEILGTITEYSPAYRQIRTLWRHGRSHTIESCLTHSAGATLESATQLSPHGSLLATVWKDGARLHVLLTPDRDADADGLPDAFENQHGFNTFVKNQPAADSDSDGLTDLDEFRNGTDPRNPDSDSDGMQDGWEVSWGFLPLDPTDAALDPDNDRVTNLRESQIGTTPTGIFKVETRHTDTTWSYPSLIAADDAGNLILTGAYQYAYDTDAEGFHTEQYSQELWLHPAGDTPPLPLPPITSSYRYNDDWSQYAYSYSNNAYATDPATGNVRGFIQRYQEAFNGTDSSWSEENFLIPDTADTQDESTWIPWGDVESALRAEPDPVLAPDDSLYPWPVAVSPSGACRIHFTAANYRHHLLDQAGNHLRTLPEGYNWQQVNDQGEAVAGSIRYVPAANGVPAHYQTEIHLLTADQGVSIHPIPVEPENPSYFSIRRFSNDRKLLLSRTERTEQMTSVTRHYLLDLETGALTRVRQPGLGYESIVSLSTRNSRLLGTGTKPFLTTPDGTCIRLEALRIKNGPTDTPLPFATLYPKSITPHHIAPDGRITLTTTNAQHQYVILQITPHNDADGDGISDDWETSEIHYLRDQDPSKWSDLFESANLDPNGNYWNGQYTAIQRYTLGLTSLDQELLIDRDSDGDEVADALDADPLDKVVDWQKIPEPRWFLVDLNLTSADKSVSDVSHNGVVLVSATKDCAPDYDVLIDQNREQHVVPLAKDHFEMIEGEFYLSLAKSLIGDRMLGFVNFGGEVGLRDIIWDPTDGGENQYIRYQLNCYPDDILDSPGVFQVRDIYDFKSGLNYWTPFGYLPGSFFAARYARIEQDGNVVSMNLAGQLLYWIFNPLDSGYSSPISINQSLDEFYGMNPVAATMTQPKTSLDSLDMYRKWHLVTGSVVLVSRDGGAFRRTKIGENLTASFMGAGRGWFMADTNQSSQSTMLWCNGFWKDLRSLAGKLGDEKPEWLRVRKMRDNGVGVAEVKYPGQEPAFKLMIPATVTEVAPKLVDEKDVEIPGSETPLPLPDSTPMVERDPTPAAESARILDASTQRIAWRELKLKVGKAFANKTATWTMSPQFTPCEEVWPGPPYADDRRELRPVADGPRFRGNWSHAVAFEHRHRFSASREYGAYGYAPAALDPSKSPANGEASVKATTQIDSEGYTAIRVNVPPIGLNKARITLEVEGSQLDILDLEVPAVVVIDPGHGGIDGGADSISRKMTEAQVVLDVALRSERYVRESLKKITPNFRLLFTRKSDIQVSIDERVGVIPGTSRQGVQRYRGADIFLSVHCNSGGASARRVETNIQWGKFDWEAMNANDADQGNYNHGLDMALGKKANNGVASVLQGYDPTTPNRGVVRNDRYANGPGVLRDSPRTNGNNNGMMPAYHPLRSALLELEFISNANGDALLISGRSQGTTSNPLTWNSGNVREDIGAALAESVAYIIVQ